jgi:hypothetical protein
MFVEDLFTYLSTAISVGSRIYPQQLPQGATFPAIRYLMVSDPPEHTQSGRSSLRHPRYQFDCFDQDLDGHDGYLGAKTLADGVMAALDGYKGAMGNTTCQAGFQENGQDNFDPETGRHWVTVDFEIWHTEA